MDALDHNSGSNSFLDNTPLAKFLNNNEWVHWLSYKYFTV